MPCRSGTLGPWPTWELRGLLKTALSELQSLEAVSPEEEMWAASQTCEPRLPWPFGPRQRLPDFLGRGGIPENASFWALSIATPSSRQFLSAPLVNLSHWPLCSSRVPQEVGGFLLQSPGAGVAVPHPRQHLLCLSLLSGAAWEHTPGPFLCCNLLTTNKTSVNGIKNLF